MGLPVRRIRRARLPWQPHHRVRAAALGALALLLATITVALPSGALPATAPGVALLTSPDGNGYAVVSAAGQQYTYGSSRSTGELSENVDLTTPVVDAVAVPHGAGSWLATRDGGVLAVGGARSYGTLTGRLDHPVVTAIVATSSGRGYWLLTAAGDVAPFGDARSYGSLASLPHPGDVVAMAVTPSGRGYWLATAGGAVVGFGDAPSLGTPVVTARERRLAEPSPLVALLSSATGRGYLAVAGDGTTYAFGDFADPGSLNGMHLTSPVVSAAAFSAGSGVWLLTRNGGVISLHAPFYGSIVDEKNPHPKRVIAPIYTSGPTPVDGGAGGLVVLPCRGADGVIVVSALVARQVSDLLAAAGGDGVGLCATSSFRNAQQQVALRAAYCTDVFDPKAVCSRPVALPGRSLHEQGLAIDFSTTPVGYAWLATHAPAFGLHHLKAYGPQTEPWHYSTSGG